jgi:hypothetical protein
MLCLAQKPTLSSEKPLHFVRMRAAHPEERVGRGQQQPPRQKRAQGPMPDTLLGVVADRRPHLHEILLGKALRIVELEHAGALDDEAPHVDRRR